MSIGRYTTKKLELGGNISGVFNIAGDGAFEGLEFDIKISGRDGEGTAHLADDGAKGGWCFLFVYVWHTIGLCNVLVLDEVGHEPFNFVDQEKLCLLDKANDGFFNSVEVIDCCVFRKMEISTFAVVEMLGKHIKDVEATRDEAWAAVFICVEDDGFIVSLECVECGALGGGEIG